ncbi:hypothetical protein SAMN05443429_101348 [Cruoricaptor ignavus]|uniref:Uncharacterized protein n=1 Tax=Cruoricaptor ignavus TaxID=1118202 RepID=A0A1M6AML8_9FLAO|nr:hypothetical protein [Cruoricaptor ignavus]SHI37759.1 hypothetical protein SAMN05443429_101348 [Cruoricaptor ignavus]
MKKIDALSVKAAMPKPETIRFLLNYSQSLAAIKTAKGRVVVCKN